VRRCTFVLAPAVLVWTLLSTAFCFGQKPAGEAAAHKQLHQLFATEWDYSMQHSPEEASSLGDRRWNDRWSDESLEAHQANFQHAKDVLLRLARINRVSLSTADQLNYDLFKKDYEMEIEGYKYRRFLVPLNQRGGIQTTDELGDSLRFETLKDYQDWIVRLQTFPRLMDQTIALMQQGIKEHMVHPKVIMGRIPGQIDKQIVDDPAKSGFYKPFLHFPKSISPDDQQRLRADARKAVEEEIVPAYKKFKEFFVTQYLPACFDKVGV